MLVYRSVSTKVSMLRASFSNSNPAKATGRYLGKRWKPPTLLSDRYCTLEKAPKHPKWIRMHGIYCNYMCFFQTGFANILWRDAAGAQAAIRKHHLFGFFKAQLCVSGRSPCRWQTKRHTCCSCAVHHLQDGWQEDNKCSEISDSER